MGNILNIITSRKITSHIIFLKDYLTQDKIEILKFFNEDFLIDKDLFLSFFSTSENYFNFFDKEGTGLINLWEILTMIHLLKTDTYNSKIQNILKIFTFTNINWDEPSYLNKNTEENNYENATVTFDEIKFISEIFVNVLIKLFVDNLNSQEDLKLLNEWKEKYLSEIFSLSGEYHEDQFELSKLIK